MCMSKPPKVKPIASAPTASAEIIDSTATAERDRYRQRGRSRNGRQSTIITGEQAAPQAQGKTLLGQ